MSHDQDITEEAGRVVTLSFTANGAGCWIFVEDEGGREKVRLAGKAEAVRVAEAIVAYYRDDDGA